MRRWFLSYHSPDQALAERLKAALERKDTGARVFFAPSSLRAKGFWSKTLAEEIAQADAFILLVGQSGVGDWQVLEYDEALDKRVKFPDFPVILVLLEGQTAPSLPFLRRLHWIITSDPSSEKDVARLLDAASGGSTRPGELWRYTSPYCGLEAMTETHAGYFFGRVRETAAVLKSLMESPRRLPVIIGASGVGKTSIARAGVMSALKAMRWPSDEADEKPWPQALNNSRGWGSVAFRPGYEPLLSLASSLLSFTVTEPVERLTLARRWAAELSQKASLSDLLDATQQQLAGRTGINPERVLLYLDQSEELYTIAREANKFAEVLARGLENPRLVAFASLGSQYLGNVQSDQYLFNLRALIDIPPLNSPKLLEVTTRPAQVLGAYFEDERLPRHITETVEKQPGALPILSFLLTDMWSDMTRRGDGVLRLTAGVWNVADILASRAEDFFTRHPGSELNLRRLFTLRLAFVSSEGEPLRRLALRNEFSPDEWSIIEELVDQKLVVVGHRQQDGEIVAEVAHEALLRNWPRLSLWIEEERDFLVARADIERAERRWRTMGTNPDALLMGWDLKVAKKCHEARPADFPTNVRNFIVESIRASEEIGQPRFHKLTKRPIAQPRGSKIFVSYRRLDTMHIAGRLYDRLATEISADEIFFDVDTVPVGVDFKQQISSAVNDSAVMLVLIGERWLNPNWKKWRWWFGSKPNEDFVQVEIESALDLGVPIFPLLVDSVAMPRVDDLPNTITEFASLNAVPIRSGRDFHKDMETVLERLRSLREQGVKLKRGH